MKKTFIVLLAMVMLLPSIAFASHWHQMVVYFALSPLCENGEMYVGDSITYFMPEPEGTCNRGIGGDTTIGITRRLQQIMNEKPTKLYLLVGVNDLYRRIPITTVVSRYRSIIDTLQIELPTSQIYICSVLPTVGGWSWLNRSITALNNELELLAAEKSLSYIDYHTAFLQSNPDTLFKDGLHPNARGYQLMEEIRALNP